MARMNSQGNPDPAGPLKVIPTSPADVTLSWDGSDDPNTTVDNFDIYVGINEPNLALVTPIDKDLGMSHVVSGLVEGDVVTWRVDSTVTFDSAEIMGEPLTQVIEGFPWSFTVSEDGPVTAVDWDNNPNTIASWPGAVAPMSVTVTDTGSSAVSYTYSATEPNLLFDDGVTVANPLTTSSSAVGVSIDWNPGGTHTLTVEAHDAANPLDVATATTQIRFFDDACNATRSGLGADLAGDYPGDIALDAELYPNSRCVIDLQDIALLVADWLADYAYDAPFEIIPAE